MKFACLGLLGIVGVALVWLAVANWVADSRLEAKLAELRQAGQPLSLSDLARKPIPPETNAATYLRRAKSDLKAIEKMIVTAGESPEVKKLEDAKASDDAIERSEPMMQAYRQAVEAHPNVWPLLERAATCPDYDAQLDYSTDTRTFLDNYLSDANERPPIRALRYRALVQLADGKRDEALGTCLVMLRLAKHFDQNPMLIGSLVAAAVRMRAVDTANLVLRSGPLPNSAYDALETELARHDIAQAYQQTLTTERAFGIQSFDDLGSSTGYLMLPMGKKDQYSHLELFDAAIQDAARPYLDSLDKVHAVANRSGGLTRLTTPALEAASVAVARTQASMRSLRVLNAILARQRTGHTDEPKLADLGLPAEATIDPFNGRPLQVKKTADGWLVYSVGSDQIDDGGKVDDGRTDVGLAPVNLPIVEGGLETGNQ